VDQGTRLEALDAAARERAAAAAAARAETVDVPSAAREDEAMTTQLMTIRGTIEVQEVDGEPIARVWYGRRDEGEDPHMHVKWARHVDIWYRWHEGAGPDDVGGWEAFAPSTPLRIDLREAFDAHKL
jgi:hypothetical protein